MQISIIGQTGGASGGGGGNITSPIPKTWAEIDTMVSGSTLVAGQSYKITDPIDGGSIFVNAISANEIDTKATWKRTQTYKARGFINIQGTTGSVTNLSVGGVNQLTATQTFASSIANLAIDIVNNINANPTRVVNAMVLQGLEDLCVAPRIILEAITPGVGANGTAITASFTGDINARNLQNLFFGFDSKDLVFEVSYGLNNTANGNFGSRILSCFHPETNSLVSFSVFNFQSGYVSPISGIRDDGTEEMGRFKRGIWKDVKLQNTVYERNFLSTSEDVFTNTIFTNSIIKDNCFQSTTSFASNMGNGCSVDNCFGSGNAGLYGNTFGQYSYMTQSDMTSVYFIGNKIGNNSYVILNQIPASQSFLRFQYCNYGDNTQYFQTIRNQVFCDNIDFGGGWYHTIDVAGTLNMGGLVYSKTDYSQGGYNGITLNSDNPLVSVVLNGTFQGNSSIFLTSIGSIGAGTIQLTPDFVNDTTININTTYHTVFLAGTYIDNDINIITTAELKIIDCILINTLDKLQFETSETFLMENCNRKSPKNTIIGGVISYKINWKNVNINGYHFEKFIDFDFDGTIGNGEAGSDCLLGNAMDNLVVSEAQLYLQPGVVYDPLATVELGYDGNSTAFISAFAITLVAEKIYKPSGLADNVNPGNDLVGDSSINLTFTPQIGNIDAGKLVGFVRGFVS